MTTLFTFTYGNDILYLPEGDNMDLRSQTNKGERILGRYNSTNTNSNRPRLLLGESAFYAGPASNMVFDGSYIKLKSITLTWLLPPSLTKKIKVSNASMHLTATNLLAFTSYPGPDPEISDDPYSLIGGNSDSGSYPTTKQYSLGLRFSF